MMHTQQIEAMTELVRRAGRAIMDIYQTGFGVEYKADESPLTTADKASHKILMQGMAEIFPGEPILSEEGKGMPFAERQAWKQFFLVDPLDGTKEFIKKNGEFTINIGLIKGNEPLFGFLHGPVRDETYYGGPGFGAFKTLAGSAPEPIAVKRPAPGEPVTAVSSRSHPAPDLQEILDRFGVENREVAGSAYKFALVADGRAHLYARTNPTMEWDTAAGHAIVLGAGGAMTRLTGEPFVYNKEELLNPGFIVTGWTA
jgi:3'(2'), 5'-bisphosphate nucleotidase